MSIVWLIYLGDIVKSITIFTFFLAAATGIFTAAIACAMIEGQIKTRLALSISSALFLFFSSVAIFTPSKESIYMMAAAAYGQELAAKPEVQDVGNKVLKILNNKLDEMLPKTEASK